MYKLLPFIFLLFSNCITLHLLESIQFYNIPERELCSDRPVDSISAYFGGFDDYKIIYFIKGCLRKDDKRIIAVYLSALRPEISIGEKDRIGQPENDEYRSMFYYKYQSFRNHFYLKEVKIKDINKGCSLKSRHDNCLTFANP